jgi:hypothetical protein
MPFRTAVRNLNKLIVIGLVLHIIEEDVYLSVKFKSWGENQIGSFSYERSTQN